MPHALAPGLPPGHLIASPMPERFRAAAAALHLEAFAPQIGPILGRGPRARAYLAECIDPAHALAALSRDGARLLGLAGMRDESGGFMNGGLAELFRHYGALGGGLRGLAMRGLERPARPGVLLLEGICVAPAARGAGIGGALLQSFAAHGRSRGAAELRLEVARSNPRAAALYARHGFEEIARTAAGPFARLVGDRGASVMARRL